MRSKTCLDHLAGALIVTALALGRGVTQDRNLDSQIQADVLRSLAGAPELRDQAISAATSSGVVTLSGTVRDDSQRRRADQLASTTKGVSRVVDELTVSSAASATGAPANQGLLQSDGSYAPAEGNVGDISPQIAQAGEAQQAGQSGAGEIPPPNGPDTDPYGRPLSGGQGSGQQQYPQAQPPQGGSYPGPGEQPPYGRPGSDQQPPYGRYAPGGPQQGYGQAGGQAVTLPSGTVLRVRVNQHLSSRDVNVGTAFDAMVVNDVVADGQVAIPRGAFVQGTVVDAASSGHLKGRGELGLQLTQVTLGGRTYPIQSDVFSAHGGDKTIQTVNSTLGLGALGAIFGAVAGGGAGAAIGAGVGGAAGLGASAASGRGDVFIPSEAVLTFRLTQPASVTTVSQTEMQRLAYGVPGGEGRGLIVRRPFYPYPYVGPVFYPRYRYYRPYGYYPYY